jgi:NAD(P)-dependent dehydrogenase (short-subunit alcohol dehydrogenase family)
MTIKSVIVGGTRGIGLALARRWSQEGHQLSIVSRHVPAKENQLPHATYASIDLFETKALASRVADLGQTAGAINHLVFFQRHRGEGDTWDGELAVSLTSTKVFVDGLVDSGHFAGEGPHSIVVIGSVASRFVAREQSLAYHIGKAGLAQMVRYYAVRLGSRGIRVNAVSSSAVVKDENRAYYERHADVSGLYRDICPLGRMATSEDIVNAVDFLASDRAGFITGQELFVDGGLSLQWHESMATQVKGID